MEIDFSATAFIHKCYTVIMKFLQTSDWHLGKTFFGQSLYDDQAYFLQQVMAELAKAESLGSPYDALIIPGDIYDRAVPPAESVSQLGGFLSDTHRRFPSLHIFMLSGNHDSSERLSFVQDILAQENIHLCTDAKHMTEAVIIAGVAVYQLPFLNPGSIAADESAQELPLRSQQDLVSVACERIAAAHRQQYPKLPALLCAHLFAAGSKAKPESERSYVGTADQVGTDAFAPFAYTALGHIHSFQQAGPHAYYSGAPLCYSFEEAKSEKYLLSVALDKDGSYSAEKIFVKALHRCTVIKDSMQSLLCSDAYDVYKDDYIQAICTDTDRIENPLLKLRSRFPRILAFGYAEQIDGMQENASLAERRAVLSTQGKDSLQQIFSSFLKDLYGADYLKENEELVKDEISLYMEYAKSCED